MLSFFLDVLILSVLLERQLDVNSFPFGLSGVQKSEEEATKEIMLNE